MLPFIVPIDRLTPRGSEMASATNLVKWSHGCRLPPWYIWQGHPRYGQPPRDTDVREVKARKKKHCPKCEIPMPVVPHGTHVID